jgi:hypothetical protein
MASKLSNGGIVQKERVRRLKANNEIQELFQGENKKTNFPGARFIRTDNLISIQIYRLHITDTQGNDVKDDDGNTIYNDVPTIAIWTPRNIGKDFIGQDDNNI